MKQISLPLAASLMILIGIMGVAGGYYLTPEYRLGMYEKNGMDLGPADRGFDLRYVNAMIAHHRGAMLLAEEAAASKRPEIAGLAQKILADEPGAIAELYAWKKDWYGDARPVRDPAVARLGAYDERFDLRFLNALIAHHEAGIAMTAETRTKSSRAEVLDNADAVEKFLTDTLVVLKGWRKSWYNA